MRLHKTASVTHQAAGDSEVARLVGPVQAADKSDCDRVGAHLKDNWDGCSHRFCRERCWSSSRGDNHGHLTTYQTPAATFADPQKAEVDLDAVMGPAPPPPDKRLSPDQ